MKAGLPTCDNKRLLLILVYDLSAYLKVRREKNKQPCLSGEIYRVRCRTPKQPAGEITEYQPITAAELSLKGGSQVLIRMRSLYVMLRNFHVRRDLDCMCRCPRRPSWRTIRPLARATKMELTRQPWHWW